jgi:hypothetical protein
MTEHFKVGQKLYTFEEFDKNFKSWCNKNYHPIHVQDSQGFSLKDEKDEEIVNDLKYKKINFTYVHYGKRNSRATGKRAGKSLRRECPFEIKLSCSKSSKYLEIKKVCFEHTGIPRI